MWLVFSDITVFVREGITDFILSVVWLLGFTESDAATDLATI